MQADPFRCFAFLKLPDLPSIMIFSLHVARRAWILAGIAVLAFPDLPARSQQSLDLTQTSIEDLMKTQISSVSKKDEQLLNAPAAVYVVTREEIRTSDARNIPDALRLVPGMDVNEIDASTFDVGIRGFDERFSNKMLVMIDGRSLYSPIFGGIYWDSINLVMDDIDRIEVIRGPGGSLWGTKRRAAPLSFPLNLLWSAPPRASGTHAGEPAASGEALGYRRSRSQGKAHTNRSRAELGERDCISEKTAWHVVKKTAANKRFGSFETVISKVQLYRE